MPSGVSRGETLTDVHFVVTILYQPDDAAAAKGSFLYHQWGFQELRS